MKRHYQHIGDHYRHLVSLQHPAHTWDSENIKSGLQMLAAEFGTTLKEFKVYGNWEVFLSFDPMTFPPHFGSFFADKVRWRTGAGMYGYHVNMPTSSWFYVSMEQSLHELLKEL
jgi:hypothetical protein